MRPRIKVVHAAKFYPPVLGGMETVVADLCNGTAQDWDVSVVAANLGRSTVRERCGQVDVIRAATLLTAHSVPLCPMLPWHLWTRQADCLVFHEPSPLPGTALYVHVPADRFLVWHHSDLVRPWWAPPTYGRLQRSLYRRADCVIVSSPNLAAQSPLVQQARRVAIIPFGIDLERYRQLDAAGLERVERLRARVPGPRVLFVGRFVYYKGAAVLVEAMRRCPGTLVMIGEGPLESDLRRLVASLGLADRVVFVGHVSDDELRAYYHACDVLVLPSVARTEAFGVVQVEAMAAGMPVVSTNLPTGVPWVNQDGVTGLVVPPADPAALADALRRILTDTALGRRLSLGASARAQAMFSRQRMIDAFKDLVETAVFAPERLDMRFARAEVA
jgi:rhamnosyl/mannosyltransferase